MPLAVLQVVRPAAGGIRAHVLSLMDSTRALGVSQSIAAPEAFLQSLPTLPEHASPLEIAARLAPLSDLRAALRLAQLARTADMVQAHGLRAGWIAALAHSIRPFPLILTAHNVAEGGTLTRLAVGLIGRRARCILAVSQAVAESVIGLGVSPPKVRVVPNGVNLEWFAHLPTRTDARRALGLSTDTFTVGCIARLSPEKGVDVLLRAASLLPDMQFVVAGDGPARPSLEAALPPNVRLLGRITDTRLLLAAADLLAVPSRTEGQGIVALEAMAAGVPVVASQVGGLAEMLTDNDTALLVPAGDGSALASALARLQGDPSLCASLATRAATLVRDRYTLAQMARAVADIYRECAAPSLTNPVPPS